MKLYVLRATVDIGYQCPDEGWQDISSRYEDIEFSSACEVLDAKADDLNAGFNVGDGFWSARRAEHLQTLHSDYDNHNYDYSVVDVSDLVSSDLVSSDLVSSDLVSSDLVSSDSSTSI